MGSRSNERINMKHYADNTREMWRAMMADRCTRLTLKGIHVDPIITETIVIPEIPDYKRTEKLEKQSIVYKMREPFKDTPVSQNSMRILMLLTKELSCGFFNDPKFDNVLSL